MEARDIFFTLLRIVICNDKADEKLQAACTPEKLEEVYTLAKKHDLAHLVGQAISMLDLPKSEAQEKCKKAAITAYGRYVRLEHDFQQMCQALEEAKIPFIPLKGSVMRAHYPEPWMRTSCDIDVLIHEEDLERAVTVLSKEYGYVYQRKGSHDISLFTPGKMHVELHYNLIGDHIVCDAADQLENVWDMATVRAGFALWHEMPDEMAYLYHITHMAKHVENGGCGIRPFMDLYILDNLQDTTKEKRDVLLGQAKLLVFANVARNLSRIWFANVEYDPVSRQLEDYILRGGVYGNNENRIVIQQQKKGGRFQYLLSKVFLPYDIIKFHYPILQKHRWLMPIMQIRRWCKIIFCGNLKRTTTEIRYNNQITRKEATSAKVFLQNIGL